MMQISDIIVYCVIGHIKQTSLTVAAFEIELQLAYKGRTKRRTCNILLVWRQYV